jgi:hypothetical protein
MGVTRMAMVVVLGAAVLAWTGIADAHEEGHEHGASGAQGSPHHEAMGVAHTHERSMLHGGQVAMTKQHHFETVFAPDGIRVYIYTEAQAPMTVDTAKGSVALTFKDGKKMTVPMVLEAPAANEKTVYFCPMHPDVVQMEPGVCPKCGGMKLFTQDRLFAKVDLSKVERGTMEAAINITDLEGSEPKVAFFESYAKLPAPETDTKPEGQQPGGAKKSKLTE